MGASIHMRGESLCIIILCNALSVAVRLTLLSDPLHK